MSTLPAQAFAVTTSELAVTLQVGPVLPLAPTSTSQPKPLCELGRQWKVCKCAVPTVNALNGSALAVVSQTLGMGGHYLADRENVILSSCGRKLGEAIFLARLVVAVLVTVISTRSVAPTSVPFWRRGANFLPHAGSTESMLDWRRGLLAS